MFYEQSGPTLIARLASSYLGRHVEVGSSELRIGRSFVIELGEVRVYAGREPVGELRAHLRSDGAERSDSGVRRKYVQLA